MNVVVEIEFRSFHAAVSTGVCLFLIVGAPYARRSSTVTNSAVDAAI